MVLIAWAVLGLIFGVISDALLNDAGDDISIVGVLIGVVGAIGGGLIANLASGVGSNGFSLWSIASAVISAIFLRWVCWLVARTRRSWGVI